MVAIEVQSVAGRLNTHCRSALEGAVGLTVSRTHYNVEIEHWMTKLADAADTDMAVIMRHFAIDPARLISDLTRVLDKMKTGNSRTPALSPNIVKLMRDAWLFGSLQCGEAAVRSGHLLVALLTDDSLAAQAREASGQFVKINGEALRTQFASITADSAERGGAAPAAGESAPSASPAFTGAAADALKQFTVDLTARAREGMIDPVLGRDVETRQIVDILTRRRQNNPILTGEAGVGKTAVVEGFALRVASGDVPPPLREVSLLSLDLGLLQAGAGVKGEFENRLKNVIEGVKASPKPIIMFIDEAHTLIGAGGAAGQNDAANLLKPALARGEMRTIAATTWAEYKKYFERDPALTRRFQVVKVDEPSDEQAIGMLRGLVPNLEHHHGVRVLAEAVEEAVRLSRRYIPSRQLPDKGVSLLDTASARVAIAGKATPAAIEDRRRQIDLLDTELAVLEREIRIGSEHAARVSELTTEREKTASELAQLEERYKQESDLIGRIRELHKALDAGAGTGPEKGPEKGQAAAEPLAEAATRSPAADPAELRADLQRLNVELAELQGEYPLIRATVDAQAVAEVVANWTGIPVGRMVSDEIKTVLNIKDRLEERVIGQTHALDAIAETIQTSRAKLTDPRKPIGVFLMVGTSGVGKTETALALADLLYGGEQNLTVINMSEFKEEHKVSMLVGSPPGYVGYGEGGVLTEAVRRRPYSVVLLDEIEKAHPGVQDVFYQVFDKGMLRDGEGRDIDFKNTVVILTSNAGTELIHRLCADPARRPDAEALADALRPELLKTFKPAFLGRCSVIPYFPLADDIIRRIADLQLNKIRRRFADAYRSTLTWDGDLIDAIASRCTEVESGARNIEYILSRALLPKLSAAALGRMADGDSVPTLNIAVDSNGEFMISSPTG